MLRVASCLAAIIVLFPSSATGHSFVEKTFQQLVTEAEHIFLGTVTAISAARLPNGAIVSHVTIADVSVVKGDAAPRVLIVLGGTLDGEEMRVAGIPEFLVGRRYLLFERGNGHDAFPFVGGTRGIFRIEADAIGAATVLDAFGAALFVDAHFDPSLTTAVPLALEMLLEAIRDVSAAAP